MFLPYPSLNEHMILYVLRAMGLEDCGDFQRASQSLLPWAVLLLPHPNISSVLFPMNLNWS